MTQDPRPLSLVKLVDPEHYAYAFKREDWQFVFLGEIPNMLGHCVVIGYSSGEVYSGFHTENFSEVTEDEEDELFGKRNK